MRTSCTILALVFLGLATANAEKVDMPPARLLEQATHVVVGRAAAIYARTAREGGWSVTRYVAEVRVDAVEKGAGIVATDPLYVRYWTRTWAGPGSPPPSTSGHRGLPKEGDRVRLYLARNAYDGFDPDNRDGGYNVIGANGFEALPAATR